MSFGSDVKRLPLMVSEFTAFLPVLIAKFFERRQFINAFASIAGFGVTVGIMLGTFRGKWEWAWRSTLGAWAVLLFSVTIAAVARYIMKRKGKTYHKRY